MICRFGMWYRKGGRNLKVKLVTSENCTTIMVFFAVTSTGIDAHIFFRLLVIYASKALEMHFVKIKKDF